MNLDSIRARCESATPGPWKAIGIPYNGYDDPIIETDSEIYIAQTAYDMQSETQTHNVNADTEFIAASRTDIPQMLAEIVRLTTDLAMMTAERDEWERMAGEKNQPTVVPSCSTCWYAGCDCVECDTCRILTHDPDDDYNYKGPHFKRGGNEI
jgi:hypothetical protein